jgi:hypothetical protein
MFRPALDAGGRTELQTTSVVCAALFSSLVLSGALSAGDRFYPGEPLPPSQVALVMVGTNYRLDAVTLEGKPRADLVGKDKAELLPGQHHVCVYYLTGQQHSVGCVDVSLNAQAGHTYYIYGNFPAGTRRWDPVVVDFAREEDYVAGKEGKRTQQRALKYFQGNRDPAKETAFRSRGQDFSVWR